MPEEEQYHEALKLALKKLRTKDRFEAEVREFLSEFPPSVVDRAITRLKERRIIDDTKTTLNLTERYSGRRSVGLEKLRTELLERGAPEEIVNTALSEFADSESERILLTLAAKFSPTDDARLKAARFLSSRGFQEEGIESALDRFFQN